VKYTEPLPGTPTVGVLTSGVTPTSEFVCMFSFPNGDARWTQGFILVQAKEGPTSSWGESLYYLAPKCLYMEIQGSLDVDSKS